MLVQVNFATPEGAQAAKEAMDARQARGALLPLVVVEIPRSGDQTEESSVRCCTSYFSQKGGPISELGVVV